VGYPCFWVSQGLLHHPVGTDPRIPQASDPSISPPPLNNNYPPLGHRNRPPHATQTPPCKANSDKLGAEAVAAGTCPGTIAEAQGFCAMVRGGGGAEGRAWSWV